MTSLEVALSSIRPAFQGVIPSPIATASADGVPNCTYLSIVWYVDEERIALSNQFLRKTAANLRANPHAVLRVIDPTTMAEYELDVTWLRSETTGEIYQAVRTQLEAVAAQAGKLDVFRLRGVELLRVDRCAPAGRSGVSVGVDASAGEVLMALDAFVRRLSECRDLAESTKAAMESLEDLFDFDRSILFMAAPEGDQLFVVASNGYERGTIGAEVPVGEGVIGVAAHRLRQVRLGNVDRLTRAGSQGAGGFDDPPEVPASGLPDAQSVLVTPLLLHDHLLGVLYLDSPVAGRFTADDARLAEVLGGHLAVTLALHDSGGFEPARPQRSAASERRGSEATVSFYDHDGTVLVDGSYVIKGVPGRILVSMLAEYLESGRQEFSNREIRLDHNIGLPAGKDNLEARLLTLRRRLAERNDPFMVERIGRGQLRLTVDGAFRLEHHQS